MLQNSIDFSLCSLIYKPSIILPMLANAPPPYFQSIVFLT